MRKLMVAVTALMIGGCGSAVINAAESGDMGAFRTKLDERVKRGDVDVDEAKAIARAVMTRQIEAAKGPSGVEHVNYSEKCADRFGASLKSRASYEDEVAAHATLLRIEMGSTEPMAYSHLVDSKDEYWRAVGARSLVIDGTDAKASTARTWRQRLMADTARIVRLSAVRAAAEAKDVRDTDALLEAARLDPDPEVKHSAIAALGAVGSQEAVMGLKDLWPNADHEGKLAIIHAWAAAWRKPFHSGEAIPACKLPAVHSSCVAWHQLQRVSDGGSGMGALLAALELIHDVSPAEAKTPEGNAAAVVERLIDKASPRVRVEAIQSAPIGWAHLLEAVVDAADDSERRVAVAALSRLTEIPAEREKALASLRTFAKGQGLFAADARTALVKAKDKSVSPYLEAMAKGASGSERSEAAAAFAQLGDANRAAALLGDKDAEVRTNAACAILAMED